MSITASMVKELRDSTGIAMMKCKKALEECNGDMSEAIDLLRKQGLATADKKSDRATNCGGVGLALSASKGVIVTLTCETDFVSGNDVFKTFLADVAQLALDKNISDLEALKGAPLNGATVAEGIVEKVAQLGENMVLAAIEVVAGEAVAGYLHSNGQLATVVAGSGSADTLRNVAMHVAAASPSPVALSRDQVDPELLAKEREIIAASDEILAKPENIRPKIIEGKLSKFYKENVLLEQEMLVDAEKGSVEEYAKAKGIILSGFARVKV